MTLTAIRYRLEKWFFIFIFIGLFPKVSFAEIPDQIAATIQPLQSVISGSEEINVEVSYTNTGDYPIKVLSYETALVGSIKADILDVYHVGYRVQYIGPIYKRMKPSQADYVWIQPGETRSAIVALDRAYAITNAGEYSLSYKLPKTRKQAATDQSSVTLIKSRPAYKLPPTFSSCNNTERSRLDSALSVAESLAARARNDLRATPIESRSSADRYREWFGQYNSTRWNKVQNNFDRIFNAASSRTVNFDCACAAGDANTVAYVYTGSPYNVYVCPIFWSRPTSSGADSKAGIIIHELSHFNIVADTDDVIYGTSGSRGLANSNPDAAVRNADSYEYFAENPFGRSMPTTPPPGGTPTPDPAPEPEPEPVIPDPDYSYLIPVTNLLLVEDEGGADPGGGTTTPPVEPEPYDYPELPPLTYAGGVMHVQGEEGDWIVGDTLLKFDSTNANFEVPFFNGYGFYLRVRINNGDNYSLDLARPDNVSTPLTVGRYLYATRAPFQDEGPGLSFSGNGRGCNQLAGEFTITEIEYLANATLSKLKAEFVQRCDSGSGVARGRIHYDSTLPPWPERNSEPPTGEPFPPVANRNAPGSTVSVVGAALFLDDGSEKVFDASNSSIYTYPYRGATGFKLRISSDFKYWYLSLARGSLDSDSQSGQPLSTGVYDYARRATFAPPMPGLEFAGNGVGCNQIRGKFRVFEIEHDETGVVERLVADFTQYCDNAPEPMRGSIVYNKVP